MKNKWQIQPKKIIFTVGALIEFMIFVMDSNFYQVICRKGNRTVTFSEM